MLPSPRRILWVWSTPRSMSTLMAKCISRLDGVAVLHEPFTDAYYFSDRRRSARYGAAGRPLDEVWRYVSVDGFAPGTTFVKELAFQAEPYVDDALVRGGTHAFLYRHPAAVARSLLPLKPDFTEDEFGFVPLARMFERVARAAGPPLVMNGEELRAEPEQFLRRYCDHASLVFHPRALCWPREPFRRWKEHEAQSQRKWHRRLESSTGVLPPEPLPPEPPAFAFAHQRAAYQRALRIFDAFEARRRALTEGIT
jgi:hypothetical protein